MATVSQTRHRSIAEHYSQMGVYSPFAVIVTAVGRRPCMRAICLAVIWYMSRRSLAGISSDSFKLEKLPEKTFSICAL